MTATEYNIKTFIINGKGGAGKDTFIDLCQKYCNIISYSSVTRVKKAAGILGWTGGKGVSDRKFLSELKDLATWYNDGPFCDMAGVYTCYCENPHFFNALFFHVREPKEIARCAKEFNAKTLLIQRDGLADEYGNHADDDVENYDYDIVIRNNGSLEELEKQAEQFVRKYVIEEA